jgi:hypothetical protein
MLDPVSALSVAGTVVQFITFCGELVSASQEVYNHSTLDVHSQAASAADSIVDYTTKLLQHVHRKRAPTCLAEDE